MHHSGLAELYTLLLFLFEITVDTPILLLLFSLMVNSIPKKEQ